MTFPEGSVVKNPPELQKTQVWFLGWEDTLEEEMATHSSILAMIIPWIEQPGGLQSMELQRLRQNWVTKHACMHLIYTDILSSSPSVFFSFICNSVMYPFSLSSLTWSSKLLTFLISFVLNSIMILYAQDWVEPICWPTVLLQDFV